MKKWKRLLVSLLTVSMTLGASTMSVMADDTTPYTYKVTLSAGNKGTINGQNKIEQTNIASGSTVTFNLNDIQVTDDKYYVKGIRLSGRDNNETLAAPSFTVDKDADYVVAYGIKGNMVAYTVNYQDASGKSLAESQTFYGNIGDKPVVAYRYIENYIPDALALTKTLSDNENAMLDNSKQKHAFHGLYRSLVHNMVVGVSEGYKKELELVGVGYRASNQGNIIELSLGYTHSIFIQLPPEVKVETKSERNKNPLIILESCDKQLLGQVCSKIRSFRKPEPYKGKGVKFVGEEIRRKSGKSAGAK